MKIFLAFLIVFIVSHYISFAINMWQALIEDMEEVDDGGPIFYPEYIAINPFEVLEKNKNI